jgi:membrane-associated phospholipid phosphatase
VLAAIVCNAVPALLVQLLKSIFNAPRPLKYYHDAPWIHVADVWHRLYEHSFPSGHSSGVFSLCCFLALILPRQWAPLGLLFFFLALLVAYTRMYLAAHFYVDVYVGSLVGTTTTLFCFALIRKLSGRPIGIVTERSAQSGEL